VDDSALEIILSNVMDGLALRARRRRIRERMTGISGSCVVAVGGGTLISDSLASEGGRPPLKLGVRCEGGT
jgi:hypothetical protein